MIKLTKIVFTLCLVVAAVYGYKNYSDLQLLFKDASHDEPKAKAPPVDGQMLLERFEASKYYEPTPDELAEDKAFEDEQIQEAKQWLLDLDPEQRVAGLEQLSAYPTQQSESLMVSALQNDRSEEVRAAAADSLSYLEAPAPATIEALGLAMQDGDEQVRNNAFLTLQGYLDSFDEGSKDWKQIVAQLKKQLQAKQTSADMKAAINDYFADRFEN